MDTGKCQTHEKHNAEINGGEGDNRGEETIKTEVINVIMTTCLISRIYCSTINKLPPLVNFHDMGVAMTREEISVYI